MTPPVSRPWYWIEPKLRASLASRVRTDALIVGDERIVADGAALVAAGAVADLVVERGALVAKTTVEALVATNQRATLDAWIAAGPSPAALALVGGASAPAFTYLMYRAFGDSPRVHAQLSAPTDLLDAQLNAAKAWALLLDDPAQSKTLLEAAAAKAQSTADHLAVAEAAAATGDTAAARAALARAEKSSSQLAHRLTVATAQLRLFGDEANVRGAVDGWLAAARDSASLRLAATTCRAFFDEAYTKGLLAEAEDRAAGAEDFAACAEVRLLVFGDETGARRDLGQAIERNGWRWVAPVWKGAFADETAARATLDEAEAKADAATLADAAATWISLFSDRERAHKALKAAEARAKTTADWAGAAAAWNRTFAEVGEVKRCLGEMEKGAASTTDWNECAVYWIDVLKENNEATRCLGRAEEAAKVPGEFLACARTRKRVDPNPAEAARVLTLAEERAKDIGALVACATEWAVLANDQARAKATLNKAEQTAWSLTHFVSIARAWAGPLGDLVQARHSLVAGEKKSVIAEEFGSLARAYIELMGDEAEAQRAYVREMEIATEGDLVATARGWKRILGEGAAATDRLRAVEATASGESTWLTIAAAWRDGFGSAAEAERSDVWAKRWATVEKAMAAGDWSAYAQSWKDILGDENAAKERLKAAEENARTMVEWAAFGVAWHRVFEDKVEAARCIKEAESKTRFKSDWKTVAEAWRQIGDYGEAQRCLDHR